MKALQMQLSRQIDKNGRVKGRATPVNVVRPTCNNNRIRLHGVEGKLRLTSRP